MLETQELIVISDLHLAPERNHGLFRADAELVSFLTWVREELPAPAQVVVAGDILDFLVPLGEEKLTAFDPFGASNRTHTILDHHPEVCDALAQLLTENRHNLTFMSGNHDSELILPAVQEVVEARLRRGLCRPALRWAVQGEALAFKVGSAKILVEHGDQFDDWNRVDRRGLQKALLRISRGFTSEREYRPSPGTQIVVDFVTPLVKKYPWIHILKPEREAVFPILYRMLSATQKYNLVKFLMSAIPALASRRIITAAYDAAKSPSRFRLEGEEDIRRRDLVTWLHEIQGLAARDKATTKKSAESICRLREISAEDGYFELGTNDNAIGPIYQIISQGFDLVVAGHTHSAKAYKVGSGLHVNTGTWCHLLSLPRSDAPDADWESFMGELERGTDLGYSTPTFLRASCGLGEENAVATLGEWKAGDLMKRRRYRFAAASRTWSLEK